MTDYVLYIHGVNVRNPSYADGMDRALKRNLKKKVASASIYWDNAALAT